MQIESLNRLSCGMRGHIVLPEGYLQAVYEGHNEPD